MEKLTKIIATISGKNCSQEFISELYHAGMDAVRVNTAHQDLSGALELINCVRGVSDAIPIIIDTKGPEIRTTSTCSEIVLAKGDRITIKGDKSCSSDGKCICVNYDKFTDYLNLGDQIMIDDGSLELIVIAKEGNNLICEARNDGEIKSYKSINVPGIDLNLPSLNERDIEYVKFAIENNIEFIAHSFVRNKEDVMAIQTILDEHGSKTKIIAKIENQMGVDNLDEILPHVYGIMVARGDLAVEIPAERIPVIQRQIINKCIHNRKVVIVATQMLHTMIDNPRPTRAEIADIANAVYTGTDCIMLSGETAYGKYPVEAVKVMTKTALEVEKNKLFIKDRDILPHDNEVSGFLAGMAVNAIEKLDVKVIICDTDTGKTAKYLSAFRGNKPIFAQCYDHQVKRELALVYAVTSNYLEVNQSKKNFQKTTLNRLLSKGDIKEEDLVVILAGNFGHKVGPSFVEISAAINILNA